MAAALSSNAAWLQSAISELLISPYIHFRAPAAIGIRLGPGPIDVFSTRFNNDFTPNRVDREELKQRLLGLQQHYSPDTVTFETPATGTSSDHNEVHVTFTGLSKETGPYKVAIDANVKETSGTRKISSINMEGNPELFRKKASSEKIEL
ncbi:hypothetical protein M422DRAFT_34279 [Sphaerobolus stellatus SS14]|uniref:Uncharacterized protein n=1 Tax=Sphaerobolus stellatus (strain SS14) TaxID=990650 RepID=A0A0C9U0N4_SPHS4|nr:hypothetical protein M422DRAFT_34279 [Sphaerobolus stellatus SS14]